MKAKQILLDNERLFRIIVDRLVSLEQVTRAPSTDDIGIALRLFAIEIEKINNRLDLIEEQIK